MPWPKQVLVVAASLAAGLLVCAAILVSAGVPAGALFDEFVVNTLFDGPSFKAVLNQAAPMILVGLAGCLAFRARFWNLGFEGQMTLGAMAATAITIADVGPPGLRLMLMCVLSMLGGLLWAWIPAALKLKLGVNEIISTLMLNYVAANLLLHLVYGPWKDASSAFPHSAVFRPSERLPEVVDGVGSGILLAVVMALGCAWLLQVSRAGLYLRFVHAGRRVAEALGVPVAPITMAVVLVSGALCGVAGFVIASGQEGRLTQAFYVGYGFSGILIAFLARNNPLGATLVAWAVATLFVAGRNLQVFYQIPFAMVQLIEAILVMAVASSDFFVRHRVRRVGATRTDGAPSR